MRAKHHRPVIYPFPVWIYEDPIVQRLTPIEAGLYRLLIEDLWRTGIPLPETEFSLIRIAKADCGSWKRHKAVVYKALEVTIPFFEEEYKRAIAVRKVRQSNARKSSNLSLTKRRIAQRLVDDNKNHISISTTPLPPKKFHEGFNDLHERNKSLVSHKASTGKLLSDG